MEIAQDVSPASASKCNVTLNILKNCHNLTLDNWYAQIFDVIVTDFYTNTNPHGLFSL